MIEFRFCLLNHMKFYPISYIMECMKYEIHMNGGKKKILDLIKLELLREKYKLKGIEKFYLDLRSFV